MDPSSIDRALGRPETSLCQGSSGRVLTPTTGIVLALNVETSHVVDCFCITNLHTFLVPRVELNSRPPKTVKAITQSLFDFCVMC